MESSMRKRAEKFLREKKNKKLWLAVFLCLAVIVASGTFAALTGVGQAMTHKKKILDCQFEAHEHTDDCYAEIENEEGEKTKILVCGLADYVVHVHNDDCYDEDGELVCQLPEVKPHEHTEDCYEEQEVLVCGLEEGDGGHVHDDSCRAAAETEAESESAKTAICGKEEHTHSEDCYETVKAETEPAEPVLVCELEESGGEGGHTHDESCYETPKAAEAGKEEKVLVCGLEEHTHGEDCFPAGTEAAEETEGTEAALACGLEEGEGGHVHSKSCYQKEKVLVCGELELHTHTEWDEKAREKDPEKEAERDTCHDEEGNLICGMLALEEHVHTEECFSTVEMTDEEVAALNSKTYTKMFIQDTEDGEFRVTATYGADAKIPETAKLVVKAVTRDTEGDLYDEKIEAARELAGQENPAAELFYDISFYVGEKEVEPKAPVSIEFQMLQDGIEVGAPVTVVHFGEDETKVYEGTAVTENEDGNLVTNFESNSFSQFVIFVGEETEEDGDGNEESPVYDISDTFDYETDQFVLKFKVEGRASPLKAKETEGEAAEETAEGRESSAAETAASVRTEAAAKESEAGETKTEAPEEGEDSAEGTAAVVTEAETLEKESAASPKKESGPSSEETMVSPAETGAVSEETKEASGESGQETEDGGGLRMEVAFLGEGDEFYSRFAEFIETGKVTTGKPAGTEKEEEETEAEGGERKETEAEKETEALKEAETLGTAAVSEKETEAAESTKAAEETEAAGTEQTAEETESAQAEKTESGGAEKAEGEGSVSGNGTGEEKTTPEDELIDLSVLELHLYRGEEELDLSECAVTVEMTLKSGIEDGLQELGAGRELRLRVLTNSGDEIEEPFNQLLAEDAGELPEVEDFQAEDGVFAVARVSSPKAVAVNHTFSYETDAFTMTVSMNGIAYLAEDGVEPEGDAIAGEPDEGASDEEKSQELTMTVGDVGEDDPFYIEVTDYINDEDNGLTGETLSLSVLELRVYNEAGELDLSDCTAVAEITPKQTLLEEADTAELEEEVSDNVEVGVAVYALRQGEDGTVETSAETFLTAEAAAEEDVENAEAAGSTGDEGDEESAEGEETTGVMVVELSTARAVYGSVKAAVYSTPMANPTFTVQYYAYLNLVEKNKSGTLPIINTDRGKLPQNGRGKDTSPNENELLYLNLNGDGTVATERTQTEVYTPQDCDYVSNPNMAYFDKLYKNGNYELSEIWVLKEGKENASIEAADWYVYYKKEDYTGSNTAPENYDYPVVDLKENVHFTNRSDVADPTDKDKVGKYRILIKTGTVIRLVYEPCEATYKNPAVFYDYDITNDSENTSDPSKIITTATDRTQVNLRSLGQGINSSTNYSDMTKPILAFGNGNTGTGLWTQTFKDDGGTNYLNKYNSISYKGCTFNIASGLSGKGTIVYNSLIRVPNLFNDGTAKGKTQYSGYSLEFAQEGDTYTLSQANASKTLIDLDKFENPKTGNTTYTNIWTNNFWPMDGIASTDGKTGLYDVNQKSGSTVVSQGYYNGYSSPDDGTAVNKWKDNSLYPTSDDGDAHNNMFGMYYTVDFELTKDYTGPLEYLFFGDDDMWVFLSPLDVTKDEDGNVTNPSLEGKGQLICDIGGVHSSVGEYVNLWDYVNDGTAGGAEGNYRLSFFYTERGLSGSSCYMQFTLPSVSSITPEQDTGSLRIEKKSETLPADMEYEFGIKFTTEKGDAMDDDYRYRLYDSNTGKLIGTGLVIHSGGGFKLKAGQYALIDYLPEGTNYEIIENAGELYTTDVKVNGEESGTDGAEMEVTIQELTDNGQIVSTTETIQGKKAAGTITNAGAEYTVEYINEKLYALPETGGSGTYMYILSGFAVIAAGWLMYGYSIRRKGGRR